MRFRNSSMRALQECPRKFQLIYVEGQNGMLANNAAVERGNIFHKMSDFYFTGARNLVETIEDSQQSLIDYGEGYDEIISAFILYVGALERLYSQYETVCSELHWEMNINGIDFEGTIDKIVRDKNTGIYNIVDIKTSKNSLSARPADLFVKSPQLQIYQRFAKEHFKGKSIGFPMIDSITFQKTKISFERHTLFNVSVDDKEFDKEMETISEMYEFYLSREFFPRNPSISCNWCSFHQACATDISTRKVMLNATK